MKKLISSFITLALILGIPLILSTSAYSQEYEFVLKWGSHGRVDGQFLYPYDVAVDSEGNVYVSDFYNYRIQKFDSDGNFITKWGSNGTGDGQFRGPRNIAIDKHDNVYVADSYNNRIQKFDSVGNFITKWGENGYGDGEFTHPNGIALDSKDFIYVSDGGHRIQKFNSVYSFITTWGIWGYNDGQFRGPRSVAIGIDDNVYVADSLNNRIQKFDSVGNFITKWGAYGTSNRFFRDPYDVAVDSEGNVYVSDYLNHRIQKFDSDGSFITKWGSYGTGDGQFNKPSGVAIDLNGNVYVADNYNNRIQKFSLLDTNQPPVAVCKDIEIPVDENCQATITPEDVDGGSHDPDKGDIITLSVDNEGPFTTGTHSVTLTVRDQSGEYDTCEAFVTVIDNMPPEIFVSEQICEQVGKGKGKMANKITVVGWDNCSEGAVTVTIDKVEVFNNGGNFVRGKGICDVMGDVVYVYPNGNGWSVKITATATDEEGNFQQLELGPVMLVKCKK